MYPLHRIGSLLSPEQQSSSLVLSQTLADLKEEVNGGEVRGDECCGSKEKEGVEGQTVNTESEGKSMDAEVSEIGSELKNEKVFYNVLRIRLSSPVL